VLAVAAEAGATVWLYMSWNITRLDLNPTVLTLAMLLPITSIFV
jgi:hypothetical protein